MNTGEKDKNIWSPDYKSMQSSRRGTKTIVMICDKLLTIIIMTMAIITIIAILYSILPLR